MTALPTRLTSTAPDDQGAAFAAISDAKGLAYATRCANAAVLTAATMLDELRPSRQGGC